MMVLLLVVQEETKYNLANLNSNSINDNLKELNKINGKTSNDLRIDKKHDFTKFDTY